MKSNQKLRNCLTRGQVAQMLNISYSTLARRIKDSEIHITSNKLLSPKEIDKIFKIFGVNVDD